MSQPILIKKYGNRRLYDTSDSRYITLDELALKIQDGADVQVIDVNSGTDLTQVTLTQIIIEGRGAAHMLPVPLLTQLIRLGDDALAEFLGQYLSMTLDFYLRSKQSAAALSPFNPFASLPFTAADAFARMWQSSPFARDRPQAAPPVWPTPSNPMPHAPPAGPTSAEVAALRSELEELKRAVQSDPARTESAQTSPARSTKSRGARSQPARKSRQKQSGGRTRRSRKRDRDS